jgi:hypothetical protein
MGPPIAIVTPVSRSPFRVVSRLRGSSRDGGREVCVDARRLCQTISQLQGRGDEFGVVCGDATVGQLEDVFQADAHVDSGGGGR